MSEISVVIPTMNRKDLLRVALDSVASQTRPCMEAVVLDAGDDGSDELCRNYSFVRYFRQTTRGLTEARNEALALVRGQYVGMLDSDDFYEPQFLELTAGALDKGSDVAYAAGFRLTGDQRADILHRHRTPQNVVSALVEDNFVIASFTLQRRCCFERLKGYRLGLKLADDYDLYLRMAIAGFQFVHVPVHLANRRHHEGSLTLSNPEGNIFALREILQHNELAICALLQCEPEFLYAGIECRLARHFFASGNLERGLRHLSLARKGRPFDLRIFLWWALANIPGGQAWLGLARVAKGALERLRKAERRW